MEQENLVTVRGLASIIKVPISWIYQRTRLGNDAIPHIKLGKYLRFYPSEVIESFKKKNNGL